MEISEVEEETKEELDFAMDRMLKSLKNSKIVLESLNEELRKSKEFHESSLNNVTNYIKNIEGISQVCENEF